MKHTRKQPPPDYYTPPAIAAYIQSARARDAMRTRRKRLEILLINPPFFARKAKAKRKPTHKANQ